MNLIDLPDGGKAWVCENIELAIFPERYTELMNRVRSCTEGRLFIETFGGDDRKEV